MSHAVPFCILFGCIFGLVTSDNAPNVQPSQHLIPDDDNWPSPVEPSVTPNAFTEATWGVPSLQKYLNIPMPGYQASEILFNAVNRFLAPTGQPDSGVYANLIAEKFTQVDQFTFSLYLHLKGNFIQKFLDLEGIYAGDLPQTLADCLEKAVSAADIKSYEDLEVAILTGYIEFVFGMGYNFDNSYILGLLFNNEAQAYLDSLKA